MSRVYLFEEHRDAQGRTVVSQRYEWVAPGITPQIDNPQLQNYPYAEAGYARWAEAFARGEAIHGVVREFPPEEQPLLQAQDIRAIAVVPVRVHGRRWGVLGFDDCVEERRWSTGEIEALRVAAETLGAAIERAELEQKLHRRQRELEALVKIATTLGERLEREAVFARVHEALAQLIPGDAFSLALVDSQKGEIRLAYGVEEGRRLPEVVVPFDPARSLSAWVAATRSPLLIRDAKAELEELPASPQQIGRFARSFLGVPLVVEEEVVGVLSVQSFAPGAYTADHLTLLQAAAAPIAVAVRNAQLFADRKQLEDKLRAVEEASRRMKLASDRETLYQIALDLARDVLGHSPCALLVPEGEELVVVAEHGELAWARGMRLRLDGPGITVAAFRSREPLYVPDVRQDPRYVASHPETKSELAHPLLVGDQVLGVFDVNSSRVDGIPPEDRDLLGIVASELAVALAGLAHLQGLEDLSGKLARLHEASLALSRASTAEEVCEAAVRAVAEVLGFDHANIGLGRGDLLVPVAGAGVLAGRARPFQRGEGIAGRVWERGETLWGNIEDFPFARPVSPEIRAFVAVPIGSRGVLQVIAPRRDAFTRNDVQLVRILARHVEEELRRVELEGELREQAIRDPLTGLYNRRFLTEVLGRELERAKRYGHPLTLVLADIDDFKKVNDRHGHGVGDRVLRRVAELLQTNVRAGDYVFRYGGEEFVVLLPETGDGGGEVVRRLRDLLSGVTVEGLPELRVSVSLGHVVWAPAEGPVTPEELLHRADAVLYAIKRARGGR
ncbi:MAG: GAF domain-containing protein [Candidatus Bipolaricaulota bacterium]|nr:GAF domain-containing protein [Candidatus Bipolaricaulota bacterium]